MPLESVLSIDPRRRWLSLEEVTDALLADVISADARFQLAQAAAWKSFAAELNHRGAALGHGDLAAGWGRQANLGMDRLSLGLTLELYRPPWWQRLWLWMTTLIGRKPPPRPAKYRLAGAGAGAPVLQLTLVATRTAEGRWRVAPEAGVPA
ncbi:hypothetical protein [Motiliproteus sediminis]|uniref:hypothetical protein n=1 Tax=Motiliproteus sediminis TaxID=1468178 RepID=UPI001AEF8DB4|nr:hypothetical protein [Motiliproteus sediminis]